MGQEVWRQRRWSRAGSALEVGSRGERAPQGLSRGCRCTLRGNLGAERRKFKAVKV